VPNLPPICGRSGTPGAIQCFSLEVGGLKRHSLRYSMKSKRKTISFCRFLRSTPSSSRASGSFDSEILKKNESLSFRPLTYIFEVPREVRVFPVTFSRIPIHLSIFVVCCRFSHLPWRSSLEFEKDSTREWEVIFCDYSCFSEDLFQGSHFLITPEDLSKGTSFCLRTTKTRITPLLGSDLRNQRRLRGADSRKYTDDSCSHQCCGSSPTLNPEGTKVEITQRNNLQESGMRHNLMMTHPQVRVCLKPSEERLRQARNLTTKTRKRDETVLE